MALDPETIGTVVFAVVSSVGAALGGQKVIDKRRQANQPEPSTFCQEHHKCFEEIKEIIGDVKADVAYIRGAIDKR
jgi:hypothetical protein